MTKSNSLSKLVTSLMVFLFTFMGLNLFAPITAHAEGNVGDVNVTVGDDGQLTVNGGGMSSSTKSGSAWTEFIKKYRNFIVGISGIGAVSMILFFVMNFMKLGANAGNPQGRSQAITGLVFSGLAAAGLGAVSIIVGFFYSALK